MRHETSKFRVDVVRTDYVSDIPASWSTEEYRQILEACEFDWLVDIADSELQDYAIISLLDYEPEEAAAIVLKVKLGSKLKVGQIENMANEMEQEKLWEEYSDISMHEKLYHSAVLLHQAFPESFPAARAMRCIVEVRPENTSAKISLKHLEETLLVRLLGDGMDNHSILKRLFSDQLAKNSFPEAENIVWQFETLPMVDESVRIILYSSLYWLKPLVAVSHYESTAFSDKQVV